MNITKFKARCTVAVECLPNAPYRTMLADLLDEMLAELAQSATRVRKEQLMPKKLKIKAWLDSGANHQSDYQVEFEVDEAKWSAFSSDEKDAYAKEYAWERMDWGWAIEEQQ